MKTFNTIGFVKSDKPFEKRIALLPQDIKNIKNKDYIYIEENYGKEFSISDQEYTDLGVHITSRADTLSKDIICDPKIGEAKYLKDLDKNKKLFGWIHAVEHPDLATLLCNKKCTCYAWEDMFENNRHVFWRNNVIAGEGAILHAIQAFGIIPNDCKAAIIGRGNTAMGANRILMGLGVEVVFYNRHMEALLRSDIAKYDIVVNALLWDPARSDHILYHKDLRNAKKNTLIIDVSDDDNGAIEGAISTNMDDPLYHMDGLSIYAVNNVPSLFYKSATKDISRKVSHYIDNLITNDDTKLEDCIIIKQGTIQDKKIIAYQKIHAIQ